MKDGAALGSGTAGRAAVAGAMARGEAQAALNASALSVESKLYNYLLNSEHAVGGPKAKWFSQALGYERSNMDALAQQIVFDPRTAVQTGVTQFGTKFNQVIPIHGANGRTIDVTFGWIRNNEGVTRLVTAIPTPR